MNLSEHQWITSLLAIYGAILSTLAVAVQVVQALRDRVRVVVEIGLVYVIPDTTKKMYLQFQITNVGRRPVTITRVGGKTWRAWKGRKVFLINFFVPGSPISTEVLPKKLAESESVVLATPYFTDIFKTRWLRCLAAYDSAGRVWKVRYNNWWRAKRQNHDLETSSKRGWVCRKRVQAWL